VNVKITEKDLLPFVLQKLDAGQITLSLTPLKTSFPQYQPFQLFRTLVLQQAWAKVCQNQTLESVKLIEALGEPSLDHLYQMWRQTTRNKTRSWLYDYLHKHGKLNEKDEEHHRVLLKITTKYPNTNFASAQKLSPSPALKNVSDDSKLPPWQPIIDLTADLNENKTLIFESLFKIPDEPIVESPRYFLGNIALIEAQTPKTLKMLSGESSVEQLWILHCEHKVTELAAAFKSEIEKNRQHTKPLKWQKFMDKYYSQMNTYELETLLDVMCKEGLFAKFEAENFELLLVRICKNKVLFEQQWWKDHPSLDFP
jgi:spatacsin